MKTFKVISCDEASVLLMDINTEEPVYFKLWDIPMENRWLVKIGSEFNLYELFYAGRTHLYPLELNCW